MLQKALVIDAVEIERRWVSQELRGAGMAVVEVSTSEEAAFEALDESIAIIVMAEEMPRMRGRDLLHVVARLSRAPIIILGSSDDPTEVRDLERGADFYMRRPLNPRLLIAYIRAFLRRYAPPSGKSLLSIYRPGLAA